MGVMKLLAGEIVISEQKTTQIQGGKTCGILDTTKKS